MDWKIELIEAPVLDVDRAEAFYAEQVGFNVGFVLFNDPDGNRWAVQQIPPRG